MEANEKGNRSKTSILSDAQQESRLLRPVVADVWGGIKYPPQIPPHEISLIGAGLVRMGGMGGIFGRQNHSRRFNALAPAA
jgi:hypothetical protein